MDYFVHLRRENKNTSCFHFLLLAVAPQSLCCKQHGLRFNPKTKQEKRMNLKLILFSWQGLLDDYQTYCGLISPSDEEDRNHA